jgi:hypothetical protein
LWRHKNIASLKATPRPKKKKLASLLTKYDLSHTVNFATRIQNNLSTAIDNIFVDNSRVNLSSVSPIINGLPDHEAQILRIKNILGTINKFPLKLRTILIENKSIMIFQTLLEKETCVSFYTDKYPNRSFLCTFFKHFPS